MRSVFGHKSARIFSNRFKFNDDLCRQSCDVIERRGEEGLALGPGFYVVYNGI